MRQVVRLDHIILLFVETVGDDDLIRVLLRVDRVLLETDIHLAEGHWRRIGADCFPECEMIAVFHGTDFLPFEICQGVNWFICAHDAESLICHAEQVVTAVGVHLADEIVKIRIIQLFAAVIQRIKDAWKVKNGEILHERNLRGGVLHDKWDIAVRARFEQVAVTAECGVGVNLNPHCAVA